MRSAAACIAAALLLLTSCTGEDIVTGDRRNVGVVTVVFSARPARARVGQSVRFMLTLVNNGGAIRELEFPRKQFYDFWARRGSREVWRWSEDQVFEPSSATLKLESQRRETYAETWKPSAAGTYRVFGVVEAEGYDRPLEGTVVIE